jgi:hypothetical protein
MCLPQCQDLPISLCKKGMEPASQALSLSFVHLELAWHGGRGVVVVRSRAWCCIRQLDLQGHPAELVGKKLIQGPHETLE